MQQSQVQTFDFSIVGLDQSPREHFQNKHLYILVPAPLWYLICIKSAVVQMMQFFVAIWDKFSLNLVLIQHQTETTPSGSVEFRGSY